MKIVSQGMAIALAMAASGLLLALALPPVSHGEIGLIALVPAFIATRKVGFAVSFGVGVGLSLFSAYILASGVLVAKTVQDGSAAWIYAGYALFGLVIGTVLAMRFLFRSANRSPWAMAAMATLIEVPLRLYLPVHLGLSQSNYPLMLELSSLTGIWGVSFLCWWTNSYAARRWEVSEHEPHPWSGKKVRSALAPAVVLALLNLLIRPSPETGDFRVSAIQTRSQELDVLSAFNKKATFDGAQLVVWPELSAMSIAGGGNTRALTDLAKEPGQAPFVTTFPDDAEPKPHNVAALFSPGGESKRYKKRKPFAAERQMHQAGTQAVTARLGKLRVALAICFDSCFQSEMRQSASLDQPDLMVLPSLDPDTPGGVIQALHGAYSAFAAASIGLPIVRSEITAYSQIFDAHGRVVIQNTGDEDAIVTGNIKPGKRWTFFTYGGDWFLGVCAVLCFARYKKGRLQNDPSRPEIA